LCAEKVQISLICAEKKRQSAVRLSANGRISENKFPITAERPRRNAAFTITKEGSAVVPVNWADAGLARQ
jgi:hypothetical protein